jgi:hypothetical protein
MKSRGVGRASKGLLTKNRHCTNYLAIPSLILATMPGGGKFYPPRSWSTTLLEVMLVVLLVVLVGALLLQLHWLR